MKNNPVQFFLKAGLKEPGILPYPFHAYIDVGQDGFVFSGEFEGYDISIGIML